MPRLHELAALVSATRGEELYTLGVVINHAVNDPKQLTRLWKPAPRRIPENLGALAPIRRRRGHG